MFNQLCRRRPSAPETIEQVSPSYLARRPSFSSLPVDATRLVMGLDTTTGVQITLDDKSLLGGTLMLGHDAPELADYVLAQQVARGGGLIFVSFSSHCAGKAQLMKDAALKAGRSDVHWISREDVRQMKYTPTFAAMPQGTYQSMGPVAQELTIPESIEASSCLVFELGGMGKLSEEWALGTVIFQDLERSLAARKQPSQNPVPFLVVVEVPGIGELAGIKSRILKAAKGVGAAAIILEKFPTDLLSYFPEEGDFLQTHTSNQVIFQWPNRSGQTAEEAMLAYPDAKAWHAPAELGRNTALLKTHQGTQVLSVPELY